MRRYRGEELLDARCAGYVHGAESWEPRGTPARRLVSQVHRIAMRQEKRGPAWATIGRFEEIGARLPVAGDEYDRRALRLVARRELLYIYLIDHVLCRFIAEL